MRQPISKILISIIFICTVFSFFGCKVIDNSIDKILTDAANEINKNCPMTVDSETQLDNVVALPNKTLQYNYSLVNYSKDELSQDQINQLKDSLNSQILNLIKTSSDMKTLRDSNVTFKYIYKGSDSQELFSLTFTSQDYN